MSDKIRVFDHIAICSGGTSFQDLYDDLTHIYNQGDFWTDISVEFLNSEWDGVGLVITGYRLETDKEYADRQKAAQKVAEKARLNKERAKAANEARDRKQYERLKKKFEKQDNDVVIDIVSTVTKHEHDWEYLKGYTGEWYACRTCKQTKDTVL
jgi:flagellar motility protein MotE (MotC chaperone)